MGFGGRAASWRLADEYVASACVEQIPIQAWSDANRCVARLVFVAYWPARYPSGMPPKKVEPVTGVLRTLWDDLRGQGVFWLVSTPLLAAAALFVVLAKQAWNVNPWLTGGIGACL